MKHAFLCPEVMRVSICSGRSATGRETFIADGSSGSVSGPRWSIVTESLRIGHKAKVKWCFCVGYAMG